MSDDRGDRRMNDYAPTELGADAVEGILREWVDTAFRIVDGDRLTGSDPAHQMRWLHLAEPWHPARKVIAALELAGWMPPSPEPHHSEEPG